MTIVPKGCDPYDLMIAGIIDSIIEGLPSEVLYTLCEVSTNPEEFFAGAQASIKVLDIMKQSKVYK